MSTVGVLLALHAALYPGSDLLLPLGHAFLHQIPLFLVGGQHAAVGSGILDAPQNARVFEEVKLKLPSYQRPAFELCVQSFFYRFAGLLRIHPRRVKIRLREPILGVLESGYLLRMAIHTHVRSATLVTLE